MPGAQGVRQLLDARICVRELTELHPGRFKTAFDIFKGDDDHCVRVPGHEQDLLGVAAVESVEGMDHVPKVQDGVALLVDLVIHVVLGERERKGGDRCEYSPSFSSMSDDRRTPVSPVLLRSLLTLNNFKMYLFPVSAHAGSRPSCASGRSVTCASFMDKRNRRPDSYSCDRCPSRSSTAAYCLSNSSITCRESKDPKSKIERESGLLQS